MNNERLQSYTAVFIAVLALMISVWQGCEQRRHNRLSVQPMLEFQIISFNQRKTIKLSNNGLGPAMIKGFRITIDGESLDAEEGNPWSTVINRRNLSGRFSEMFYLSQGAVMKPEKTYNLLTWEPPDSIQLDISIEVEYSSIYEDNRFLRESF